MSETPSAKKKRKKPEAPPSAGGELESFGFERKKGKAPAPDAPTGPVNLFPNDERRHYETVPWGKGTRQALVSSASRDGTLVGGCFNCKKSFLDMATFAPFECNYNGRRRPAFFDALADFDATYASRDLEQAREARERVEALRSDRCPPCAEINRKLTPNQQACKDEWMRMQKDACAKFNGCQNQECRERGPEAWCAIQGDHVHTKNDPVVALRKVKNLSDYCYWAYHGGVEAMRAEAAKGINWICAFCHSLQPTNTSAEKYTDPEFMPDGNCSGTKAEIALYARKRIAKIVYPKQQFVDARKRELGECEICKRRVVAGQEHAFPFDHRDPTTKMIGKDTLAGESGGVSGLVANHINAATLDEIVAVVVNEMGLCRLLCANFDHRQTHKYPMRSDVVV